MVQSQNGDINAWAENSVERLFIIRLSLYYYSAFLTYAHNSQAKKIKAEKLSQKKL